MPLVLQILAFVMGLDRRNDGAARVEDLSVGFLTCAEIGDA